MVNNQLVTAKQLGILLALSQRQVFRLNNAGKIPSPMKIGGATRWKLSDIIRWQELDCPDRRVFEAQQKAGAV